MIKAILFTNVGNATQACNTIDINVRKNAQDAGFTADAGGIVGKDSAGNDMPNAQKTVRWDAPRPVAGGTTVPAGNYTHWIADPRPVWGENSLTNVQNWTAGEYTPPLAPDEM